MRYNFVIREHEEFGTLGLQLKDCPGMDPLPGLGTAHDIVEHFPKGNDSIKDEFLALGASLYVRGDTGHYQANGNTNSPLTSKRKNSIAIGLKKKLISA